MRRWLVRLHRWTGLAIAIYVALIGLSGSILVYRPELYRLFEPQPVEVAAGSRLLSDDQLRAAATRAFPEYRPLAIWRGVKLNQAVTIDLENGEERTNYLFDPYTGRAVGPSVSLGFRATTFLLDLHTELTGGEPGRLVDAALALVTVFLALTGVLVWKPRKRRERAATLRRLHLTVGVWTALFVLMWGSTGFHLAAPAVTMGIIEHYAPYDDSTSAEWVGDTISYWLAYIHFGRFGGVLPGCERGMLCSEGLKVVWALIGLAPVFLAISGFVMWLRGRRSKARVRRLRAPTRHSPATRYQPEPGTTG